MTRRAIILRETAISVAINAALSAAFFLAVFGLHGPVAYARLGPDFLPQTFMVSLMGTVVPALLLNRGLRQPAGPILRRSLFLAVVTTVVIGGLAWALCGAQGAATASVARSFVTKVAFGAALALLVTPYAIGRLLSVAHDPVRTPA